MAMEMSEDERSTLEAALAFIDAHYCDHTPDKAARTRARNSEAAARTHSKRRAELLRLRDESAALEAALAEMTRRRGGCKRARGDSSNAVMIAELTRLGEARATNRKLREMCVRQRDAARMVAHALQKQMNAKDLLRETAVGANAGAMEPASERRVVFEELTKRLRVFSSEATALIQATPREALLSNSRSRLVQHATQGPVMEVTSSTQLACSLDEGWDFIVNMFCSKHYSQANREAYGYSAQVRRASDCGASEKVYSLAFCDRQRPHVVAVDGLALFETFEAPDWRIFLWSSLVSIRGDGVRVRERGWTAMVKSSSSSSVLHQRYELTCTNVARASPEASPCAQTKFLVESLLLKIRRDQRRAEDVMLERFGANTDCLDALFA